MSPRKSKAMTEDQTAQMLRLLCALQRATDKLREMPEEEIFDRGITEKDRFGASVGLELAKKQLSEPTKNRYDLGTSVLLGYLDEAEKPRVAKVLKDATLLRLSHFGHRPWARIEMAFKNAGVNCPLAFASFHVAYQEELQALRGLRSPSRQAARITTTPISVADMT